MLSCTGLQTIIFYNMIGWFWNHAWSCSIILTVCVLSLNGFSSVCDYKLYCLLLSFSIKYLWIIYIYIYIYTAIISQVFLFAVMHVLLLAGLLVASSIVTAVTGQEMLCPPWFIPHNSSTAPQHI